MITTSTNATTIEARNLARPEVPRYSRIVASRSKRRDEESDRELARLVPEERLHDPRRELPHREWTTTMVIVRTSAARETIDAAIVARIERGVRSPVNDLGTRSYPDSPSIHSVT